MGRGTGEAPRAGAPPLLCRGEQRPGARSGDGTAASTRRAAVLACAPGSLAVSCPAFPKCFLKASPVSLRQKRSLLMFHPWPAGDILLLGMDPCSLATPGLAPCKHTEPGSRMSVLEPDPRRGEKGEWVLTADASLI